MAKESNKLQEAEKLIEEAKQKKVAACQKELEAVLTKHDCKMEIYPAITIQGQPPQIIIK